MFPAIAYHVSPQSFEIVGTTRLTHHNCVLMCVQQEAPAAQTSVLDRSISKGSPT